MIFFCRPGSSASPISTPRSPRATITASDGIDDFAPARRSPPRARSWRPARRCRRPRAAACAPPRCRPPNARTTPRGNPRRSFGGEFDVGAVLVRQRGQRQAAALAIEALAVRQSPADRHHAMHLVAGDFAHLQGDQAVVQQQHIAGAHIVRQSEIADADARSLAGRRILAAIQREWLIGFQQSPRLRQTARRGSSAPADPQARPLRRRVSTPRRAPLRRACRDRRRRRAKD